MGAVSPLRPPTRMAKAAVPGSRQGRPASRVRTHRRSRVIGQPGCRPDGGPCRPRWRVGGIGLPNCAPRWPPMTTGGRMSPVRAPCAAPSCGHARTGSILPMGPGGQDGPPVAAGHPRCQSGRRSRRQGHNRVLRPHGSRHRQDSQTGAGPRKMQQTIAARAGPGWRRGGGPAGLMGRIAEPASAPTR